MQILIFFMEEFNKKLDILFLLEYQVLGSFYSVQVFHFFMLDEFKSKLLSLLFQTLEIS